MEFLFYGFCAFWIVGAITVGALGVTALNASVNDRERTRSAQVIVLSPIWLLVAIPWLIWAALGFPGKKYE
jgi:hypothetical protein